MPKKQQLPHLVGSKWTATHKIDGWRHFRVVNRKNQGPWIFAELVAACAPQVRFWLNAKLLSDRTTWHPGWQSLHEQSVFTQNPGQTDCRDSQAGYVEIL